MAYAAPTPAQFKTAFPLFAAVADAAVQAALDEAVLYVDDSWLDDANRFAATMLYAAHALTLNGLGEGAEAAAAAAGASDVRIIQSGTFSLTRGITTDLTGGGGVPAPWNMTSYGRRFYALLRRNIPAVGVC
jgi:hypothetical protein